MSNEQRVLAVPTTEDPTLSARGRLSSEYLDKAFKVVEATLDLELDAQLRWRCAQWVLEMQMGKPRQEIDTTNSSEKALAAALSEALSVLTSSKSLPPVVEDGVYTLGVTVEGEVREITDSPTPPTPESSMDPIISPAQTSNSSPAPVTPGGSTPRPNWDPIPD